MSKSIKIKKGLDLKIAGQITDKTINAVNIDKYAVIPDDFHGITPKLEVKEGDTVKIGDALFHDKKNERIKFTSPVSGTVTAIVRGLRRKIERIEIESNSKFEHKEFDTKVINKESVREILMQSGLWTFFRQRPYDVVPSEEAIPRDIFITAFNSAPLAPDLSLSINNGYINKGAEILSEITDGKVYISVRGNSDVTVNENDKIEIVTVSGPHPAGNVGVQIANIAPVNKDEVVFTTDITTLARIGELFTTGKLNTTAIVAINGSEIKDPQYVKTTIGANVEKLLNGQLDGEGHKRIISGNVLTGIKIDTNGYLRFPYNHITVIPEGDDVADFIGWASLSPNKMSVNRSFPGHFLHKKAFKPDARILGGRRAMIMSGEYDKVLPMDILAEYLLKAFISKNIEQMEQLGAYEVAPEDFALAEYVDISKLELQQIVREGLDYLRKELE